MLHKQQKVLEREHMAKGAILGLVFSLSISAAAPARVVEVPVTVEKPVTVKVAQYLNEYDRQQISCMAKNAYFEAGNQSMNGKIAVSNVVMNRTSDGDFPRTPCGVIYQRRGNSCQFSWVCEGKGRITNTAMYEASRRSAEQVYLRNVGDNTFGAEYYHNHQVRPSWSYKFVKTAVIQDHTFYRG